MRTSGIMLVSLAGFGFALWLARGGDAPPVTTTTTTTAPAAAQPPPPRFAAHAATSGAVSAGAAPEKLDATSEALRKRLDEQIPTRLYAEAARCYKGGLQRDQRMDITYRIHVGDGAVSFGDVRVTESTLGDSSLERCIRDKVAHARWRDDALPDLDEDDDLYMRVAGFSAYLANADDSPASAMN